MLLDERKGFYFPLISQGHSYYRLNQKRKMSFQPNFISEISRLNGVVKQA